MANTNTQHDNKTWFGHTTALASAVAVGSTRTVTAVFNNSADIVENSLGLVSDASSTMRKVSAYKFDEFEMTARTDNLLVKIELEANLADAELAYKTSITPQDTK